MKKRWIWAILLSLVLFGMVFLIVPIYGLNIYPESTMGLSDVGGYFGKLHPLSVYSDY